MNTARCPSCHSDIIIEDDAYEGDLVDCINCRAQTEISALHPPQVRLVEGDDDLDDVDNPEDENDDKILDDNFPDDEDEDEY